MASSFQKYRIAHQPPAFEWSSLWKQPTINAVNLKSYTLPILNVNNPYGRNFHLSWLGFFVAFLSDVLGFAFPPLIPEAISSDLGLTSAQVGNSNIVSLAATLGVRVVAGSLVDRYGPRWVMSGILVLGAIPSGLVGTARSAEHLYVLRFFIGILGGTFVPAISWTTCFFDKNVVGAANAFAGGWGNTGGGVTFIVMASVFAKLVNDGMSEHLAWRVAFPIIPVPILLLFASATLLFGTDHPAGKWSERHNTTAKAHAIAQGLQVDVPKAQASSPVPKDEEKGISVDTNVSEARPDPADQADRPAHLQETEVDLSTNEKLTMKMAGDIMKNPRTWLPALSYMTSFGFELAAVSFLSNHLYSLYRSESFTQLDAGYYTSVYGFLNAVNRPAGGYLGDWVYKKAGVKGKKYTMLALCIAMGLCSIGLGVYFDRNTTGIEGTETAAGTGSRPDLPTVMGLIVLIAVFEEAANGATFALVPHCNPASNGFVSGLVGAMGNMGGIIFALVFRFAGGGLLNLGRPWWICGLIHVVVNLALVMISVPES